MRLYRATFIALIAAAGFGFANQALAEVHLRLGQDILSERAVFVVTVDEFGRTIFRCTGIECDIVDCSGNGQLAASGDTFLVRREGQDSCATENATLADTQVLDQKIAVTEEKLEEAAAIGPEPGSEGEAQLEIDPGLTAITEAGAAQTAGESDTQYSPQP